MRYMVFSCGELSGIFIKSAGYAENPLVTRFGPSVRDEYIIHYVLEGKGSFNGNEVCAGQGFLITPGILQEYHADKREPWKFLWIISEDPKMTEYFDYIDSDAETGIFNYDFLQQLVEARRFIVKNSMRTISCAEMSELFFSIFKGHMDGGKKRGGNSAADTYVDFAVSYIKSNSYRNVTVKELTEAIGVSQPYLFRIFKNAMGKSPKRFITDCRMDMAKQLLSTSEMSVAQIASAAGFEDALTFSRAFKKNVGMSPNNYRRLR